MTMHAVEFQRKWSDVCAKDRSGAQRHVIDGYQLVTTHAGPVRRLVRKRARNGQTALFGSPNAASETSST